MMFFARASPLYALVFIFDHYGALITRVDSHRKTEWDFYSALLLFFLQNSNVSFNDMRVLR